MEAIKWLMAAFLFTGFVFHSPSQQNDQEVKEFVKVVNMMVLVRVQDNGLPVGGLKKEDFLLNENKHRVEINGFREVRRRIASRQVELAAQTQPERQPRFFLLYFWIANSGIEYKKTIDRFFESIYREGDRVVIATVHNGVVIAQKSEVSAKVNEFYKFIDPWLTLQENETRSLADRLERKMEYYLYLLKKPRKDRPRNYRDDLRLELENSWREFKFRHLRSNFGQTLQLARALKSIKEEKWALVFFQPLRYPMLRTDLNLNTDDPGEIAFLDKLINDQLVEGMTDANFPQLKDIQQAFIAANATFHVLQPPASEVKRFSSNSFKETPVHSNWEETFRQISKATGGIVASGSQLEEILDNVMEREDIYYELSYAPGEWKEKKRSLKVSLLHNDCTVFYVRKAEVSEQDLVTLDQMTFLQPILKFCISNFQRIVESDRMQGHLSITVTATSAEGKNIQYTKELTIEEAESIVSLRLNFPRPGTYRIVVEVLDRLTDRQAEQSLMVDVTV